MAVIILTDRGGQQSRLGARWNGSRVSPYLQVTAGIDPRADDWHLREVPLLAESRFGLSPFATDGDSPTAIVVCGHVADRCTVRRDPWPDEASVEIVVKLFDLAP